MKVTPNESLEVIRLPHALSYQRMGKAIDLHTRSYRKTIARMVKGDVNQAVNAIIHRAKSVGESSQRWHVQAAPISAEWLHAMCEIGREGRDGCEYVVTGTTAKGFKVRGFTRAWSGICLIPETNTVIAQCAFEETEGKQIYYGHVDFCIKGLDIDRRKFTDADALCTIHIRNVYPSESAFRALSSSDVHYKKGNADNQLSGDAWTEKLEQICSENDCGSDEEKIRALRSPLSVDDQDLLLRAIGTSTDERRLAIQRWSETVSPDGANHGLILPRPVASAKCKANLVQKAQWQCTDTNMPIPDCAGIFSRYRAGANVSVINPTSLKVLMGQIERVTRVCQGRDDIWEEIAQKTKRFNEELEKSANLPHT